MDLALLTILPLEAMAHSISFLSLDELLIKTPDIIFGIIQLWLEYARTRESLDSAFEPTSGFLSLTTELGGVLSCIPNPVQLDETFYGQEKGIFFSKISSKQTPVLPRKDTALSRIVHFITCAA